MRLVPYGDPQRFVHRLEAFSDIVIGFSLAQLSLSLTIPRHISDLVGKPVGLLAFAVTFMIICTLWLRHHKWFEHYFVPTPVNVVLNFGLLGAIVVLVYAMQVFLHFNRPGESFWPAFSLYLTASAIVFFLFGIVFLIGVAAPRRPMTDDIRIAGYVQALRLLGAALGIGAGLFAASFVGSFNGRLAATGVSIIVCSLLGRMAGNAIGVRATKA